MDQLTPSDELPEYFMSGDFSDASFNARCNSNDIAEILNSSLMSSDIWQHLDQDLKPTSTVHSNDANTAVVKNETEDTYEKQLEFPENKTVASSGGWRSAPSLSTVPWTGDQSFTISISNSERISSKWKYSTLLKKLYVRSDIAVPVEIKMGEWVDDCVVNLTPVYVGGQHSVRPVVRCFNHKQEDLSKNLRNVDHIVKVENPDVVYRLDNCRYSVDVPLHPPAPGEESTVIYFKCDCLTSCAGGPFKRPFCIVFTLFNSSGQEVGRQILDLKVCACPIRDCENKEIKLREKRGEVPIVKKEPKQTKSSKRFKLDLLDTQIYEQINVPVEIVPQVKRYVNQLMAEKHAKEHDVPLPFPEY